MRQIVSALGIFPVLNGGKAEQDVLVGADGEGVAVGARGLVTACKAVGCLVDLGDYGLLNYVCGGGYVGLCAHGDDLGQHQHGVAAA